jgi:hypothetical protein
MRGSAVFRTGVAPGGALAGPWVQNSLWTRARAVPSLDLRFADNKSLVDATTGANLVDFTRASSGTYVGSDGVLRTATTNLLTWSEDTSQWFIPGTGITISQNQTTAPTGALTADQYLETATTGLHSQNGTAFVFVTGNTYTYSVYVKPIGDRNFEIGYPPTVFTGRFARFSLSGSGSVQGTDAGVTAFIQAVGDGWYRCSATNTCAAGAGSRIGNFINNASFSRNYAGDTAVGIYIWGAQLEQSTTVGEYIPTTSTINSAPRFDHNPTTGESLGLLVEEARTNTLLQSNQFDTSWTLDTGNPTISLVSQTAPDGGAQSWKLTEGTSTGFQDIFQTGVSNSSGSSVYSVYAKAAERFKLSLRESTSTGTIALFDLSAGSVVVVAGGGTPSPTATITPVKNGWYRCSVRFNQSTTSNRTFRIFVVEDAETTANGSIASRTGDGTSGLYLWGAQLEAGAFPTSYIPTVAATVTRAADVASITGSNFGVTRTNLLVRSEEFDNASWTKTRSSVTANAITAPNGTLTADELVEDTTVTSSHNIGQPLSFTSGTTYTISVFAKATASPRFLQIIFPSGGFTATRRPVFDLLNGIASAATDTTASIQNIGDGWYRCIGSMLATNTNSASIQLQLANTYTNSVSTYTGDGVSGVYIWGAQLEVGSAATPYIQSPSVFTSRASSGTYVGGNGLIQTAVTNLLLRSEEFDDATWTKTRSSITANAITAPDGTLTGDKLIDSTAVSASHFISQSISFVSGPTYTVSIFAKQAEIRYLRLGFNPTAFGISQVVFFDLLNGVISANPDALAASITDAGNGWWRLTVTATATSTASDSITIRLSLNGFSSSFTGTGTDGLYLWGAQLEQASTVGEYIPTTSTINSAARYDHDPISLIGKGLLLEEARTNLILRSEEFDDASWTKASATITANESTAPDGTTTADLWTRTGSTSTVNQSYTKDATARTYSGSIWVKSSVTAFTLALDSGSNTNRGRAVFDFATGVLTTVDSVGTFTNTSGTITAYPDSWYRVTVTTTTSTATTVRFIVFFSAPGATAHIWGAQLEEDAAFATSYIPTTTATVTRAADISTSVATSVFENSWYRQDEGTVFVNGITPPNRANFPSLNTLHDGTSNNRLLQYVFTSGYFSAARVGSVPQGDNTAAVTPTDGSAYKVASAFAVNNSVTAVNGVTGSVDTLCLMPTALNTLAIGAEWNNANIVNSTIRRLTYWPTRLGNEVLQRITQ